MDRWIVERNIERFKAQLRRQPDAAQRIVLQRLLEAEQAKLSDAETGDGLTGAPRAVWRGMLPAGAGLNALLTSTVAGDTTSRWFTPLAAGDLTSSRKYPLATYAIIALGRASGTPLNAEGCNAATVATGFRLAPAGGRLIRCSEELLKGAPPEDKPFDGGVLGSRPAEGEPCNPGKFFETFGDLAGRRGASSRS